METEDLESLLISASKRKNPFGGLARVVEKAFCDNPLTAAAVTGGLNFVLSIIPPVIRDIWFYTGIAAAIAVLIRIWLSFIEFIFIGLAFYLDRKSQSQTQNELLKCA